MGEKGTDEPHTYKSYLKMDYELKYVCKVFLKMLFFDRTMRLVGSEFQDGGSNVKRGPSVRKAES